jgi:hypothetical protein
MENRSRRSSFYPPRAPGVEDVVHSRKTGESYAHGVWVVDADRNRNNEEGGRDRDDR